MQKAIWARYWKPALFLILIASLTLWIVNSAYHQPPPQALFTLEFQSCDGICHPLPDIANGCFQQDCEDPGGCGNEICAGGETVDNCLADCPTDRCGNGYCASAYENASSCSSDCSAVCGDGYCTHAEDGTSCAVDCASEPDSNENGQGGNLPPDPNGQVPFCGDRMCNGSDDSVSCPTDCPAICGDRACTNTESPQTCPTDCLSGCGNGILEPNETPSSCPQDAGIIEETVVFDQTVRSEGVTPQSPEIIRDQLEDAGFSNITLETIEAATEKFLLYWEFSVRRIQQGTFANPRFVTAVTIRVVNPSNENYGDISLLVNIPKSIAPSISQIESQSRIRVIQSDPIIEFSINALPAQSEKVVSFWILDKVLSEEETRLFPNPLIRDFRRLSLTEIAQAGCSLDIECSENACFVARCIRQECYSLKQAPGTGCGVGLECNDQQVCVQKNMAPYQQPVNVLDIPSILLLIVIAGLGLWILKEYLSEN